MSEGFCILQTTVIGPIKGRLIEQAVNKSNIFSYRQYWLKHKKYVQLLINEYPRLTFPGTLFITHVTSVIAYFFLLPFQTADAFCCILVMNYQASILLLIQRLSHIYHACLLLCRILIIWLICVNFWSVDLFFICAIYFWTSSVSHKHNDGLHKYICQCS